jgi:ParB-like chromosome segregation protein Spo0J
VNDSSTLNSLARQSLLQKYRPRMLADFVGIAKPLQIVTELSAHPFPSNWFFVGPPGLGKTTLGMVLADEIKAQLHHIRGKSCNLSTVEEVCAGCYYSPCTGDDWMPLRFHLVLVDEANEMSYASQVAFLSRLDETAPPPNTIFIFTANELHNLEERFLSRCRVLEFTCDGIQKQLEGLLRRVWALESHNDDCPPDFAKIIRDSAGIVRSALNGLEMELMSTRGVEGTSTRKPQTVGTGNSTTERQDRTEALSDEVHPLTQIVPEMPPKQYAALKSDIKQRGVIVPVLRYEGKLFDGRGRWRACKELGIKCPVRDYDGTNPVADIISLNVVRRHLTTSQRALIAAHLANLKHGGDRKSRDRDANLQLEKVTIQRSAELLSVSVRSVEAARKVLSEGDADLVAAVDAGKMSVSKAAKTLSKPEKVPPSVARSAKKSVVPEPGTLKGDAFWLWVEIMRFDQIGILHREPAQLFYELTEDEQRDILRIVPDLIEWLRALTISK